MDVFKLQKINALASDLKKHNFAVSSEDAFQQAEQVYVEQAPPLSEDAPVIVEKKVDNLAERRFELILEQNNRKYEQELGLLRSALNSLAVELESLKSELRKVHVEPLKQKEHQAPLKTEPKEDHPRQGKFSPSDVDIQKMFYFGNK
jgi:parvulin-like peptidyl-prolyl isomerase